VYVLLLRRWTQRELVPNEVCFVHPSPVDLREHHRVFGSRLAFSQPRNSIRVPAAWLEIPLADAEPQLRAHLESTARTLLGQLETAPLVAQLREVIVRALPHEVPPVERAARLVGMSDRTLQRRLRALDTSYQEVVDDARRVAALELLANPNASVAECAFACGFANPAAFRRAFVRWTGITPQAHRARGGKRVARSDP